MDEDRVSDEKDDCIQTVHKTESQQLLSSAEEDRTIAHVPEVSAGGRQASFLQKYSPAMKMLIPVRSFSNDKERHPTDTAGLLSTMTFSWITALVFRTFRTPPTCEELWKISEYDEVRRNYKRFSRLWKDELNEKGKEDASLWRVVLKFVRTRLIISTLCVILFGACVFCSSAIIIREILFYISRDSVSLSYGFVLVAIMFSVEVTRACALTLVFVINYRSALRMRAAVLMLVFKKVLKMSSTAENTTIGELVTMCSNDGDRIFEANRMSNLVLVSPAVFLGGAVYTCYLFGPIGLSGSLIFIALIPVQGIIVKAMNRLRARAILHNEARVKIINEILTYIKLIKMYSWEKSFAKVVDNIRSKELSALHKSAILQSVNISIAFMTPVLASVVMISAFVLLGNNLTPEKAFTCIALFNAMSAGLKFMPMSLKSIADANVSLKRLKNLLVMDMLQHYVKPNTSLKSNAIEIENASFAWNSQLHVPSDAMVREETTTARTTLLKADETTIKVANSLVLENINLLVQNGALVGIYGTVGSGKSSLISAIMGQLYLREGSVAVSRSVAYCSQQAWLMNASIRDNVVFGCEYDEEKYNDVVSACELLKDFLMLPSGDLTEVGERGINLSGGQKQRISLARALYSDKDVYLLDDPLSAVDAHIGKSIFLHVMIERLKNKGKTVLLVSHQLQYFSHCDQIYKMENATLNKVPLLENVLTDSDNVGKSEKNVEEDQPHLHENVTHSNSSSMNETDLIEQGKLITSEERGDVVPLATYHHYLHAAGGTFAGILMALFFVFNIGVQQFTSLWLSIWLREGSGMGEYATNDVNITWSNFTNASSITKENILANPNLNFYLVVYGCSAIAMFIISVIRGWAFVAMTIRASKFLHNSLFNSVLHGTMAFFDTTPTGRIINRFQKDMDEQDVVLPSLMEIFFFQVAILLFSAGIIVFVFPQFLIALAVLIPILILTYIVFRPAAREMKRLDVLTRSPWFSHISATISGLETIRAYHRSPHFISKFQDLLDRNGVPCYLFACVNRWLAIRMDFITITSCVITIIFVILNHGFIAPAYAGLALSSAFYLTGMLQFTIRLLTEGEARFVSVDRIKYYIDNTPQENSKYSQDFEAKWPALGEIEFQNVAMQYRENLPLVLRNLSFKFKGGEKIGVVGRTGSGKSSLAVALFRLVELSGGSILIDGIDISSIPLSILRSKLAIIPQDPVLFSGTVRYNLDPFDEYSDSEVWLALEQAHLKLTISKLCGQLSSTVSENGSNFSVGERQLMSLARALLRKSKILILDEATAAVDRRTEKLVYEIIEKAFAHCTIVTIAHRLSTVISSDRVLVLYDGKVVELDTPSNLLANKKSVFYGMMQSFEGDISVKVMGDDSNK